MMTLWSFVSIAETVFCSLAMSNRSDKAGGFPHRNSAANARRGADDGALECFVMYEHRRSASHFPTFFLSTCPATLVLQEGRRHHQGKQHQSGEGCRPEHLMPADPFLQGGRHVLVSIFRTLAAPHQPLGLLHVGASAILRTIPPNPRREPATETLPIHRLRGQDVARGHGRVARVSSTCTAMMGETDAHARMPKQSIVTANCSMSASPSPSPIEMTSGTVIGPVVTPAESHATQTYFSEAKCVSTSATE